MEKILINREEYLKLKTDMQIAEVQQLDTINFQKKVVRLSYVKYLLNFLKGIYE